MNKKFTLVALAFVMVVMGALSAPTAQAQEKTKLRLMGWSGSEAENTSLNKVIADFNASQDKIEAVFEPVPDYETVLQNSLVSGDVPDVFYVPAQRFPDLVKSDALMPIGDKLENPEDFYPALVETFSDKGTFYCPPKDFSVLAIQINTEMFKAAGVEAPKTWDELRAAAEKLTTDTVAGIVYGPSFDRLGAFIYAAGGEVTNSDLTEMALNTDEAKSAFEFYSGLYLDGFARTPSDLGAGWGGEAFGKGLAAMALEGNWVVGFLADQYPDLKYETIELPAGPTGKQGSLAFTVCYGIGKKAKNPEASLTLLNYLVGAEGMKTWTDGTGVLPSRMSVAAEFVKTFPDREVYLKSAEFARGWRFVSGFSKVEDKANEQLALLFADQVTVEDAISDIEKVGNAVLKGE
ncbi:MAG TPA: ABC transporter substrate-binding protein [Aggregatilineales bacterium]|nr:ABC transporter substrate-binding protein [Aggregatilineales bacterium]